MPFYITYHVVSHGIAIFGTTLHGVLTQSPFGLEEK